MQNLVSVEGAVIAARQGGGFERTFENALEPFKAKVVAQVLLEPKGYSAQVRLVCEADGKRYKVSQWEETSVGAEMWIYSQPFEVGEGDKKQTRYYLNAFHNAPKGE